MRRTLFLVPLADVPIVNAAASRAIAANERRRTLSMLADSGIGPDPAALMEELEAVGLAEVRRLGEATTAELRASDPRLAQKITLARGKPWEATISVSQKVFFHLALDGMIGRSRPRGSWIASQFHWSTIDDGCPRIAERTVEATPPSCATWLQALGTGTRDDIRWGRAGPCRGAKGGGGARRRQGISRWRSGLPADATGARRTPIVRQPAPALTRRDGVEEPGCYRATSKVLRPKAKRGPTLGLTANRRGWTQDGEESLRAHAGSGKPR